MEHIMSLFKQGHKGTAYVFAGVLQGIFTTHYTKVARFDSDVYFRKESMSLITDVLDKGIDIVGSRRCYGNNPSGVKDLHGYPDTISTYFMGMRLDKLPTYDFDLFMKMCQGVASPDNIPALDFFDPVTHAMLKNGVSIYYLPQNAVGGQDRFGKKESQYELNMHMDAGDNLVHFGGVGSGYAYDKKLSEPEKSYAEWAFWRWILFSDLFFEKANFSGPDSKYPTIYKDGRWVNGSYDEHIFKLVKDIL